ncbi:MAG: DEAD/DEAH box helicase [Homoserinimonas sp.]|nr:DEAD/DEAH box helicase [Homoserinimonas sp.]
MPEQFGNLREIATLLLDTEREKEARDRFIRFLDGYGGADQFAAVVDSIAIRLGLYPYVDQEPQGLSEAEALLIAYHTPVALHDRGFVFHSEQQKVYERLMDGESIVLSAPTSFGKSAVIDALVLSERWSNIVLIVPTIALIDETRRRLVQLKSDYTIVSHPQQQRGARNVFVLTQERFLELDPAPATDFFVIDEFYKLGSGETDHIRRSTLNIAWRQLKNTGAQYYLIGPSIDAVQDGVVAELNRALTVSDYNTVVVDVEDRSDVEDVMGDIRAFLDGEADGATLVFVSSPSRAGQLANEIPAQNVDAFVEEVAAWIGENYDPDWHVATALSHGVGTHTGPMPRSIQRAMIRLFAQRRIDRLVCTTTLIEGVNTVARNVILYDKKINRRPIDFFTFSNIRGRAGRMFKHFVGRVISYGPPPDRQEALVDVPIESQSSAASLATLVQLRPEELSSDSVERLAPVLEQRELSLDTIRRNRGLDPERQIAAAIRMRQASDAEFANWSWNGIPTNDQLRSVIELGYNELLQGTERSGVNPGSIMARLSNVRSSGGSIREMVERQLPYRYPTQTRSDVVDDVLAFQRNWMGFKIPFMLRALSAIQSEVAADRSAQQRGNYEFVLREIESLYLPSFMVELEDYGLPMPIALKLSGMGLRGATIEEVVTQLGRMAADQGILRRLTRVERWFLSDVASGLVAEMQVRASARDADGQGSGE